MPSMRVPTGTDQDALSNIKFASIPAVGAILNMFVSCATITDVFGLSLGNVEIVVSGTLANVQAAAGVVDTERDIVVMDEGLPFGQLFMPVTATTLLTAQFMLRYLG